MTKAPKERVPLEPFVNNIKEALSARTHLAREKFLWRVVAPIVWLPALIFLPVLALDGLGWIKPIRADLLDAIKYILSGDVFGVAISGAMGWLFRSSEFSEKIDQ